MYSNEWLNCLGRDQDGRQESLGKKPADRHIRVDVKCIGPVGPVTISSRKSLEQLFFLLTPLQLLALLDYGLRFQEKGVCAKQHVKGPTKPKIMVALWLWGFAH